MLTYEDVKKSEAIKTYITHADQSLAVLGFTEHSFAHVIHVVENAPGHNSTGLRVLCPVNQIADVMKITGNFRQFNSTLII